MTAHKHSFLDARPAIVTAVLGDVILSDVSDDPAGLVMDYFELDPDEIVVNYLEPVA